MKNVDSDRSICLQFEMVSVLFKGMHETFLMYKMNFKIRRELDDCNI